ncbi:MAG: hypothetical protein PVG51_08450 [Desulfosarcina sp.]
MTTFLGSHSEWNLGSPGGWDYQRVTQEIAKVVWQRINAIRPVGVDLDFDHPMLYPVVGFADMLLAVHRQRQGNNPGLLAVVAEEETLDNVTENINLARRLDAVAGITGILAAPHEFELHHGRVCHHGRPVSLIFMDFNNDVFLKLHRKHDLSPLYQAIRENRILNPRGTEPINVKSMFEVITGEQASRFHPETVRRTPWTRRFFSRRTTGPKGQVIDDLVEWTRQNWSRLVLKPARGYSGIGVKISDAGQGADAAIQAALSTGGYIVQEKVALGLWGEAMPEIDRDEGRIVLRSRQTDFRCLIGPEQVFGFLCRFGDVPTNVGSGGGVQPMAILQAPMTVGEAVERINATIAGMDVGDLLEIQDEQNAMAVKERFTYLLGPIKIALRPRIITVEQLADLESYCRAMWDDSVTLEQMWFDGELDAYIDIEAEELDIARMQPWRGGPAIFAADGLFGFGAQLEER